MKCDKCGMEHGRIHHANVVDTLACRDALVAQLAEVTRQRDMAGGGAKLLAMDLDAANARVEQLRDTLEEIANRKGYDNTNDYDTGVRECTENIAAIARAAIDADDRAALTQSAPDAKEKP